MLIRISNHLALVLPCELAYSPAILDVAYMYTIAPSDTPEQVGGANDIPKLDSILTYRHLVDITQPRAGEARLPVRYHPKVRTLNHGPRLLRQVACPCFRSVPALQR